MEVEFTQRSLSVVITTGRGAHRLFIDRLAHDVDADRCKSKVTKSRKLVLSLHKRDSYHTWNGLRAA